MPESTSIDAPEYERIIKIKLSADEVSALNYAVSKRAFPSLDLKNDPRDLIQKLCKSVWVGIAKRIAQKAMFPKPKMTIKMTVAEATALAVVLSHCTLEQHPFVLTVVTNVSDEIMRELL